MGSQDYLDCSEPQSIEFVKLNRLTDEEAITLSKNSSWTNLIKLDLSDNKIGDVVAVALSANVFWANLTELILGANKIGDEV